MQMQEHENQWKYNENIIQWCSEGENGFTFNDWTIIITFYTALHKIDYLLHQKRVGDSLIENHENRIYYVKQKLREIFTYYLDLYMESRRLRYKQTLLNHISDADLEKYKEKWFRYIKPYVIRAPH